LGKRAEEHDGLSKTGLEKILSVSANQICVLYFFIHQKVPFYYLTLIVTITTVDLRRKWRNTDSAEDTLKGGSNRAKKIAY
jgi:hypothetical protein